MNEKAHLENLGARSQCGSSVKDCLLNDQLQHSYQMCFNSVFVTEKSRNRWLIKGDHILLCKFNALGRFIMINSQDEMVHDVSLISSVKMFVSCRKQPLESSNLQKYVTDGDVCRVSQTCFEVTPNSAFSSCSVFASSLASSLLWCPPLSSIMLPPQVVPRTERTTRHILQSTLQLSPQSCHIFVCKVVLPLDILHILRKVIHNIKTIKQNKCLRKSHPSFMHRVQFFSNSFE